MVCPVCIIPLFTGLAATGMATKATSESEQTEDKAKTTDNTITYIIIGVLILITLIFLIYRNRLKKKMHDVQMTRQTYFSDFFQKGFLRIIY